MADSSKRGAQTYLCALGDLEETGATGVETDRSSFAIIVVRHKEGVLGYVNRCPHIGTPLEMFPGKFLDETGTQLVCSTHGARFNVEDGLCTLGPCIGMSLKSVKLCQEGDKIFLCDEQSES